MYQLDIRFDYSRTYCCGDCALLAGTWRIIPDKAMREFIDSIPQRVRAKLAGYGLVDSRIVAAGKMLSEHVADYESALKARDGCAKHVRNVMAKITRIVKECRFRMWADIKADKVTRCLAGFRSGEENMSIQTSNHYLQAIKQFCSWVVEDGRASQSPVTHLEKLNAETDRRRERRSLSVDEMRWMISVTFNSVERYRMSGPERAMLYVFAAETGLRANELHTLTRSSFSLDADPPTVRVKAGFSKRRKMELLPLRASTAADLRQFLASKLPAARAFNMPKSDKTAAMLREDLADARKEWLDAAQNPLERAERDSSDFLSYENHAGLVADFHSLRGQFITNLSKGGTHLPMTQKMARHSDPSLTSNAYTHIELHEQTRALDSLPDFSEPFRQQLQATGTDASDTKQAKSVLASCLARNESGESISVHSDAVNAKPDDESGRTISPLKTSEKLVKREADGPGFEPGEDLHPQ